MRTPPHTSVCLLLSFEYISPHLHDRDINKTKPYWFYDSDRQTFLPTHCLSSRRGLCTFDIVVRPAIKLELPNHEPLQMAIKEESSQFVYTISTCS